ncbi:MAG TPA: 30S ribosome-binding factor RbfA [Rhabdochlamydiaceae bacterium]|jgi:ribosome-binding factor A
MVKNRVARLNSLLKEVLSEVIHREVKNPHVNRLVSVASVEISNDLQHAKVYISVIGSQAEKDSTLKALQSAAGFIAITASKKVVMRYFPALTFKLDDSVDKHMRIESLIDQIHEEKKSRPISSQPHDCRDSSDQ